MFWGHFLIQNKLTNELMYTVYIHISLTHKLGKLPEFNSKFDLQGYSLPTTKIYLLHFMSYYLSSNSYIGTLLCSYSQTYTYSCCINYIINTSRVCTAYRFSAEMPVNPVSGFIHLDQPDQLVWASKSSESLFHLSGLFLNQISKDCCGLESPCLLLSQPSLPPQRPRPAITLSLSTGHLLLRIFLLQSQEVVDCDNS